ncbi:BHLH domain-containing protein, partial [Trichostrongylus colubriformis]
MAHRPNQHSPPQDYYDPNRNREIGSIVSLLQSHSPPSSDPYASMKFSPPNFDSSLNVGGPASMLPKLGPPAVPPLQLNHYQSGSLSQQLAAPSMQPLPPVMSPPAMYIDTKHTYLQTPPEQNFMVSPGVTYTSCQASTTTCVKVESPVSIQMTRTPSSGSLGDMMMPSVPVSPTTNGTTTKEELLRLLVNMSPGQVERLKGNSRPGTVVRARPSAVATRVPRNEVWPQDDDSDDEDDLATDEPRRR